MNNGNNDFSNGNLNSDEPKNNETDNGNSNNIPESGNADGNALNTDSKSNASDSNTDKTGFNGDSDRELGNGSGYSYFKGGDSGFNNNGNITSDNGGYNSFNNESHPGGSYNSYNGSYSSFNSGNYNTPNNSGYNTPSGGFGGGNPPTDNGQGPFSESMKTEPQQTTNAAELLNSYLFAAGEPEKIQSPKKDSAALKKLWKTVGILLLTMAVAFSGAFMCFYWVCDTALLGDSDFFRTLMLQSSGVTVNNVEVDMISGSYEEDSIALAEKIMECSIDLQLYSSDNQRTGSGSGVIISEDGLAITNYHVVYGNETTTKAVLSDGTVCKISVLHLDKIADLAVIKLDTTKKLTPAQWGNSDNVRAGQSIAICGNPLGLGFSVSFGKIGHPDRDLGEVAGNFLQLDASINPGNSGGGVFDGAGNLIGIVNAKASGTNVDGIGYAIPAARVIDVTDQLLKKGYVSGRPAIGFTLVQVNESTWDYFKNGQDGVPGDLADYLYESRYGIYIISSKYNTEILKGDRIVACDGVEFTNRDSFSEWLLKYKAGDKVKITVERIVEKTVNGDGSYTIKRETKTFTCTLYERDWADEPYYK